MTPFFAPSLPREEVEEEQTRPFSDLMPSKDLLWPLPTCRDQCRLSLITLHQDLQLQSPGQATTPMPPS